MRILYLEDNPFDADLVRRTLVRHLPEARIDDATSLREARDRLAGEPGFDVILADLGLPDGSGLDLLNYVREQGLAVAFVILTGSGDQQAAVAALKAGADDYLVKDGDFLARLPRTLLAAIERARQEQLNRGRPLQVLYAEHHRFDVDLTLRHLASAAPHLRLEVVGSAGEALARLPARGEPCRYDVLLLDYQLPGLDALDVAKIVRQERGLDLPIVMVTGHGSEEIAARAIHLGVSDYLVKHSGYLHELPVAIDNAYRQAQLARERAALRATTERLREVLALSPAVNYAARCQDGVLAPHWVSDNIARILGYAPEDSADVGWWRERVHPDDLAPVRAVLSGLAPGAQAQLEYRFRHADGQYRWVRDNIRLNRGEAGGDVGSEGAQAAGVWSDISGERDVTETLRLHNAVIESTHDGVLITDLNGHIVAVNPAFTAITGYAFEDVRGLNPRVLQSGRHDRAFYAEMWATLRETGYWQGEVWNRRRDGEVYPEWLTLNAVLDEQGLTTHYVGVFSDLSRLRQTEDRLAHVYHHDPLTNLPNRLLLLARLEHAIAMAGEHGERLAVLFVDLDRFKNVNDSLGHPVGDELLRAVAERLALRVPAAATLGRLGGDEFMLLVEQLEAPEAAATLARDLIECLVEPFQLSGGNEIFIHASIGISLFPEDGDDPHALVRNADAAMYRAKDAGRNTYGFYTEDLTRYAGERLALETRLRRAIAQDEFVVFYQPAFSVRDGTLIGAEALVRWQPPGEAMVPPGAFIPLAEETGLILPLGERVLREACRQARAWLDAGFEIGVIAVNLSAEQFRRQNVEQLIARALTDTGLSPDRLEIEITESSLMEQGEKAEDRLLALKEVGVRLAIDDFGTGYSSLAYLKRFAVDKLKIDRSFVKDIAEDRNDRAIASAVIAMARSLEIEVQAEGVETPAQLAILDEHGCHSFQGYLRCPPVPAEEFAARFLRGKG